MLPVLLVCRCPMRGLLATPRNAARRRPIRSDCLGVSAVFLTAHGGSLTGAFLGGDVPVLKETADLIRNGTFRACGGCSTVCPARHGCFERACAG
jgi:hypothetical protein